MSEDKATPEEPVANDPQPHEGDQAKEMIEEGAPSEPEVVVSEADAPEVDEIDRELAIFQDLQRLQADFVNYRARVERDRGAERQLAVADTIRAFLPVMDDLHRAQSHGDLQDGTPMAAIAQKLRSAGEKLGLQSFGEKGEKFDPERHDALVQTPNPEVTQAEIADVIEPGYQIGERMLRAAKVAVFVPND
jgi:molecular chaperone GrpE